MFLIQILLPLYDNAGQRFPQEWYVQVREQLIQRFDGLTIYTRAPADGFWQEDGKRVRDDLIVYEIMVEDMDERWWRDYRRALEDKFAQRTLVIRSHQIHLL